MQINVNTFHSELWSFAKFKRKSTQNVIKLVHEKFDVLIGENV